MKSLLLILISILGMASVNAQTLYAPGNIVKGKNATYSSARTSILTTTVRNVQNKDTLSNMYFDNGKIVPIDWYLDSQFDFDSQNFLQTFRNAFTADELNQMKGIKGIFQVTVIADKAGNSLELEFTFRTTDPVLSKFDPDRLFQLEIKLKKLLKLKITGADRSIKNIKYLAIIDYKDL